MNELKIEVEDVDQFEARLRELDGRMEEPCWFGNWYLETSAERVVKVMQVRGAYSLLELRKLETGFAFVGETPISDIKPYRLEQVAAHNVLHKIVRPWQVKLHSVDVLVFEDIGTFACVNYEDGKREQALKLIKNDLRLSNPRFIEVPFNVLKRRKMGVCDFDAVSFDDKPSKGSGQPSST